MREFIVVLRLPVQARDARHAAYLFEGMSKDPGMMYGVRVHERLDESDAGEFIDIEEVMQSGEFDTEET